MITRKALRLAAIVVAHSLPSCLVVGGIGGNHLVATCWATDRHRQWHLLTSKIDATTHAVRVYLGY